MDKLHIIEENNSRNEYYSVRDYMFKNRELVLDEEVNSESMTELICNILYLDRTAPGKEITLYINSPGGSVTDGLALYDILRLIKSPLRTVCIGTAASMGALLFLAGSRRCVTKHSQIMIHDPSVRMSGEPSKALSVKETLEDLMKVREELARIIAERTKKPLRSIYSKTKTDTWFKGEEAIAFGLATEMLETI